MRKKSKKTILKELDRKWSDAIKNIGDYKCAICGRTENLNSHHIITRKNSSLRHDLENGIVTCVFHHKFSKDISAHGNPFGFVLWLEKNRPEQYAYLKERINLG